MAKMNIIIKTSEDIKKIRKAIKIWQATKKVLIAACQPGISLLELNHLAKQTIISMGGQPTFYKMYGFPKDICISVNACVIHGVPNEYIIQDKDLVSFDVGVTYQNHVCDAAFSVVVGENPEAQKIKNVCEQSLVEVAKIIKPGITNMEIAKYLQTYIETNGYYVLHDFTGHGCGNQLHEDPPFPNYYSNQFEKVTLQENMVFCLEPMIMTGSNKYVISQNGWNVVAKNNQLTCHVEDMFLVTKDGCIVLTQETNIEH